MWYDMLYVTGYDMYETYKFEVCAAPYETNCDALCILTPFYQNQHDILQQSEQQ